MPSRETCLHISCSWGGVYTAIRLVAAFSYVAPLKRDGAIFILGIKVFSLFNCSFDLIKRRKYI